MDVSLFYWFLPKLSVKLRLSQKDWAILMKLPILFDSWWNLICKTGILIF